MFIQRDNEMHGDECWCEFDRRRTRRSISSLEMWDRDKDMHRALAVHDIATVYRLPRAIGTH